MCYWILPILIVISNLTSNLLTLNIHCIWSLAWLYYCMVYSPYYQRPKCSIYLLFTYGYLLFQLYMKLWSLVLVLKVFEPNFSWPNALPDANHQMLMHWAKAQCISLILSLSTSWFLNGTGHWFLYCRSSAASTLILNWQG